MNNGINNRWISTPMINILIIIWVITISLCVISIKDGLLLCFWINLILAVILFCGISIIIWIRYELSDYGNQFQRKVLELTYNTLDDSVSGKLLDIGCCDGIYTIKLALRCPNVTIFTLNNWDWVWNDQISKYPLEKVNPDLKQRVKFIHGSVSLLPVEQGTFDFIISNNAFDNSQNGTELIASVLKVLKPGGHFIFQEKFLDKRHYSKREDLLEDILDYATEVQIIPTLEVIKIPFMLKWLYRKTAIISGKK